MWWQNGRQLIKYGSNTYAYDYAGIRTQKNNTFYYVEDSRILAEKTGSNLIWYYYDESGVCGMKYGSADYYFEKNILGDIIAVYNDSGTLVGSYTYDAWGKILTQTDNAVTNANPFRYRGYYYDSETKLYYLNSRYYDPETGRFINADEPTMLYYTAGINGGANLFAYCLNNPVMYTDPDGNIIWIIVLACVVVGAIKGAEVMYETAKDAGYEGWELVGWTVLGGLLGAGMGWGIGTIASIALPFLVGGGGGAMGLAYAGGGTLAIAGGATLGITAVAALGLIMYMSNGPSTNKPSWVNKNDYNPKETPQQNAKRLLDDKYGPGNWRKGGGSEFSRIVKWIQRHILRIY